MSWDTVWEQIFQQQEWGRYPAESLVQFVSRSFAAQRDRHAVRILEVGCGPGANVWFLAREGYAAYGIDGSATAIAQARQRLEAEGLRADLRVGDILSLPFPTDFFDAVVDIECLYSNSRAATEHILHEIHRCLKPNGLFYSRSLTDATYLGRTRRQLARFEYTDISDGPAAGKGLVRVMDREEVHELYGACFTIDAIDRLEQTRDNGALTISEWLIVCRKAAEPEQQNGTTP